MTDEKEKHMNTVNRKNYRTKNLGQGGFTLTEVAIVLGIVGLLLAAIWSAAASVYSNHKASKTTTELLAISQKVKSIAAMSGTVDTTGNSDMTLSVTDAKNYAYIQMGVFPADMVTSGKAAINAWNGGVAITQATNVIAGDSFIVAFDALPQTACETLLVSNTEVGTGAGLLAVGGGTAGTIPSATTTTFPVVSSVAETLCTKTSNAIAFKFSVN
jgi:prepilin-type N-terminal cleavage/methylation domain-containing protein